MPLGERYQQTLYTMTKATARFRSTREPTFFVPMTGKAEAQRGTQSDEPLTPLVNGDFSRALEADQPAGWYYVRQASLATPDPAAGAEHCLTFANQVGGRSSQRCKPSALTAGKSPS